MEEHTKNGEGSNTNAPKSAVPKKRVYKDRTKKGSAFSQQTRLIMMIIGGIFIFSAAFVIMTAANNLQDRLNSRTQTAQETRRQVGRQVYDKQAEILEAQRKQEEERRKYNERLQKELEAERQKALEVIQQEELKEGHEWYYDPVDGIVKQRPITDKSVRSQDITPMEDFDFVSTDVVPPRDQVINWLELRNEDIPWDDSRMYVTKGQFFFWLTDNFLRTVGNNEIATKWSASTYTLTVTVQYGDIQEVEKLSRDKIVNLFKHSRYFVEDPNAEITINYVQ